MKELKEHLDFNQLLEPIEENRTLLADIHKGQGDSLKEIKTASRLDFQSICTISTFIDTQLIHRGQEDTLREVKAISSKMKAAAKEDATSQASLRQYLEKVEKKILDAEKKIIDQVMNNGTGACCSR